MSIFDLINFGYPRFLFDEAGDDNGGGGSGGDDDGDQGDKGGDDKAGDDGKLIDKSKIFGDDKPGEGEQGDKGEGDGKPGEKDKGQKAERPEHIPEKFWDAEKGEPRLEAMAKAYSDLEKKLGAGKKAPEDYELKITDEMKTIFHEDDPSKDPMVAWFKEYAKENNFTQEMFDGALAGFAAKAGEFLKESGPAPIDPKAEKEKLGKNADAIIENQVQFLSAMYKRGEINQAQANEILILTETADGIQALQAIRKHYGEQQNIPMNLQPGGGTKSADELRTMQADKRYGVDPEYTKTVDTEYEKKYGTGSSGQSQSSPL